MSKKKPKKNNFPQADNTDAETTGDETATREALNNRIKAAQRSYTPRYEQPGKRRPAEERSSAFNTLAWLVDGATGLVEELRHSDLGLSEDFWVHLYAARREGLLAARSAVDSLLEKSEQDEKTAEEQEERTARRGNVSIG